MDREVQKLLHACYEESKSILKAHRGLLDEIAEFLLAKETITGDELMAYVNAENKPSEESAPAEESAE